ncbi:hypothetical protein GALMADRAFT_150325 [Galerina marginata CBS 339.88]|uniref:Uncharacterized protein n=1 Tax=Galerina marginata (strain CBS 339.88) TaxID=685588 RepID=A0A067U3J3_GALM3|nr:hypothetical protein GALMADRAFT_150325 [Galerina marginata CBS 339.88]
MPVSSFPPAKDIFDDDDDDGWQDMPVVREDICQQSGRRGSEEIPLPGGQSQASLTRKSMTAASTTGNLIDVDDLELTKKMRQMKPTCASAIYLTCI